MEAHHKQAIERLIKLFEDDPRYRALIIAGSIAHGNAKSSSDIDVVIVASDEEFERRKQTNDYAYFNFEICDYPGGYIDGKVVNLQFLEEAADHASEPTRYAYVGAYPAYSHIPGLDDLLKRIATYPEHEREKKMASFYSQILVLGRYFVHQAIQRDDPYLLLHTVSDLVLFGGRLILAYNRQFFPCHKSLLEAVAQAPAKPDDFLSLADTLLRHPTADNAQAFCDCISNFQDWGIDYMQGISHFFEDVEWNWRSGYPPLEDS